ncbi:hypothetical protein V2J09_023393 [Rumex salicifolius]
MEVPFFIAITIIASQLLFAGAASPTPPSAAAQFLQCLQHSNFSIPKDQPITKSLYTPQNASFLPTLQSYIQNSRFNRSTTPKPLALVAAAHYSHVQATVACARVSGLQLRIRSGGHDFDGLSYVSTVPFVLLDMFNLRAVNVDVGNQVAWVQAGAILGEIFYDIAKKSNNSLAFPAGVVDAKGRILSRSTMGEDLFWAIRGGGAASFAVVLSWKLRLVAVPQTVTVFQVTKTLEQGATDAVDQWQRVASTVDPRLFIRAQPQAIAASGGNQATVGVSFVALYLGGAQDLVGLVKKSFSLLGLELKDCTQMSTPLEIMLKRSTSPNGYSKHKSDYVKKPISKQGWEAIWKKMIELGPNVLMQYNPYGGRMSEIADDATPFPHRAGNLFKMQYIAVWSDASLEVENKYLKGLRELHHLFTPYVSMNPREAFLNYRDIDIGTNANGNLGFASDLFKGNVGRLQKVKAKVDPDNFFRYEQSIPI